MLLMSLVRAALWAGLVTAGVAALPLGCSRPPQGGPLDVQVSFGEVGSSPGQFSYPRCLDHDRSALWVIDKLARVQRLDPKTGASLGEWQMPRWKDGKPTGVTVWDPEGQDGPLVLVPDTHYHQIWVYDGGDAKGAGLGTALTVFGEYGTGAGQFVFPTDVAVLPGPDGVSISRLYVSEYQENDRISVYEAKTPVTKADLVAAARGGSLGPGPSPFEFKFAFGRQGSGASAEQVEFSRPQSIAIDLERRELVVNDACNHRIGRFTLEGGLIAWINASTGAGQGPGHYAYPYGLSLLGDGTALVAEFGNNRVQHVDLMTGASLGVYGQPGRREGELASPWGVAVMGKRAFVLDSGNNRVVGFEAPRGRFARERSQSTTVQGDGRGTGSRGGAG
jgi:hypothetical protein